MNFPAVKEIQSHQATSNSNYPRETLKRNRKLRAVLVNQVRATKVEVEKRAVIFLQGKNPE